MPCDPRNALPNAVLLAAVALLLVGCGAAPYAPGGVARLAPTRVDPAFTGASTRVDPRFFNRGAYVGTGVVNPGPLYRAETGLRRY